MPNKSSKKTGPSNSRVLSKRLAERFLLNLANLRGAWPLDENDEVELKRTVESLDSFRPQYRDVLADSEPVGILILRDFLRKAWDATSARQRDWYVFKFRDYSQKMTDRIRANAAALPYQKLPPVPLILATTFPEAALLTSQSEPSELSALEVIGFDFLAKLLARAKRCDNPGCRVEPYFFLKKKGQKYCSETCSIPAQRAAKLRWWNENRKSKRKRTAPKA
jgi:hypothetical protein